MRYCVIEKQNEEIIENSPRRPYFFYKGHIGKYILNFLSNDFSLLEKDLREKFNSIKNYSKNKKASIKAKDSALNDTYTVDIIGTVTYSRYLSERLSADVEYNELLGSWYAYDYFENPKQTRAFDMKLLKRYLDKCIESELWSDYETFIIACESGFFPLPNSHLEHRDIDNYIARGATDDVFSVIENTKNNLAKNDQSLILVYECERAQEVAIASLLEIFRRGYKVKKCMNCDRYFIAYNRSDAIYCDNASPQDKTRTCKEYGSQKLWYDRLKNDETKKLARNIYMAKQMLVKRNPDIAEYEESFEKYKLYLKQWKADIKAGTKTEAEYIEWLRAVKERKVL